MFLEFKAILIFSDRVLSFLISSRLAVLSAGERLARDSLNKFAFCSYVSLNSFNPFSLVANVKRSFVRRGFTCDIAVCISAILRSESCCMYEKFARSVFQFSNILYFNDSALSSSVLGSIILLYGLLNVALIDVVISLMLSAFFIKASTYPLTVF